MNLYSSEVICNSTEGSTLPDFLHTCTLNCREKSDEFRESSKRMASECDVTSSERYRSKFGNLPGIFMYKNMSSRADLFGIPDNEDLNNIQGYHDKQ